MKRALVRNALFCCLALAGVAGCRGSSGTAALPFAPDRQARGAFAAQSVSFVALGPTHMTSGGRPTSGKVNAFAIDPSHPSTIYVASGRGTGLETYSSAGIYRTTDGGQTWTALVNGLTDTGGVISSVVNALWLDPSQPSVVLAATEYDGIFRSSDGGNTWHNVFQTTQATQFARYGRTLFAATAAGILRSANGGLTWKAQLASTSASQPTALASVTGSKGSAMYAGGSDGTIYRYDGEWVRVGKLPYDDSTGRDGSNPAVHQLAVDPFQPDTVYASSNDGHWDQDLHASVDGGKTWNSVLKGRYGRYGLGTQAIAFSQTNPHMLYVGADGGMYRVTGDGSAQPTAYQAANLSVIDIRNVWVSANGSVDTCWVASDQGLDYEPNCSKYANPRDDRVVSATSATGLARRFTVSPDGTSLLVSLQDFDSHATFDGGRTWYEKFTLYEDGFNELRPGDPNSCYTYDEASGLGVSTNGCRSLSFPPGTARRIAPSRLMTSPIAFDPGDAHRMLLASGPLEISPRSLVGVFETKDDGRTFKQLKWPISRVGCIVFDPKNAEHLIAGGIKNGRSSLSVTFDGGKTWRTSSGVTPTPFWYAVSFSPVTSGMVLATSVDASNDVFVLRSTDGGRTFVKLSTVTNAPLLRGRIGAEEKSVMPAAFVYSPARAISYNQSTKNRKPLVALTTLRGAYVSSDDGATWQRVDNALIAHSFWAIRWRAGYLYLASDGQGIVKSKTPLQR